MQLKTDRLILRRPTVSDVPAMSAYSASERACYTGGFQGTMRAWMQSAGTLGHWEIRGYGLWAVTLRDTGDIVGLVGPFYPDGWPETEFGWMLFDGYEGQGYAEEAARAALAHARESFGWTDIVHYIVAKNTRSIALAEKLGATLDPDAAQPFPERPILVYRQGEVAV